MTPPIRVAQPADHAEVLRLIRAYFAYDNITLDEPSIAAGLSHLLSSPALGRIFLAEENTRLCGYAIITFGFDLELGGRQATLTDLYLEPDARHAGLGSALIASAEDVCRRTGAHAIELQVERDNHAALTFYRAKGFASHDRIPLSKRLS